MKIASGNKALKAEEITAIQADFNECLKRFTETNDKNGLYKTRYNYGIFYRNIGLLNESAEELIKGCEQMDYKATCCN